MALKSRIFKILPHRNFIRASRMQAFSTETITKPQDSEKSKQTHFGFQTVNEEDKWKKVHEVFETVADKYDVMNDAMSMGIHRLWKDMFMLRLAPTHGTRLLDVAGGTGDITFRYINYLRNLGQTPEGKHSSVTVCDINQAMLDVGKARAESRFCKESGVVRAECTVLLNRPQPLIPHDRPVRFEDHRLNVLFGAPSDVQGLTKERCGVDIEWVCGDAEKLPLPDDTYSAYTIAFGIRNCTHIDKVLSEAYRVLTPGGRFMCLEFGHLDNTALQWMYDQYSFQLIPALGQLIAGQWRPYQYLVESIRQFPHQEKFKCMIEDAGFRQVTYENLTFGVAAIHSAFKL